MRCRTNDCSASSCFCARNGGRTSRHRSECGPEVSPSPNQPTDLVAAWLRDDGTASSLAPCCRGLCVIAGSGHRRCCPSPRCPVCEWLLDFSASAPVRNRSDQTMPHAVCLSLAAESWGAAENLNWSYRRQALQSTRGRGL